MKLNRPVVALVVLAVSIAVPLGSLATASTPATPTELTLTCIYNPATPRDAIMLDDDYTTNVPFVCSGHMGIHNYFVGRDQVYKLRGGCLTSRPVETGFVGAAFGTSQLRPQEPGFAVETSMDGVHWQLVNYYSIPRGAYNDGDANRFCGNTQPLAPGTPGQTGYATRATLLPILPDSGVEFRFLRVRQPVSGSLGLSGYMDTSGSAGTFKAHFDDLLVEAVPGSEIREATVPSSSIALDCRTDLLDAVFPDRPCSFGGLNWFDSASRSHTYFIEHANVTRVTGTAAFMLWRSDLPTRVYVQGNCGGHGHQWVRYGSFVVANADPVSFDITVPTNLAVPDGCTDARHARLIRLVTNEWGDSSSQHEYAGYFLDSRLTVYGDVTPRAPRPTEPNAQGTHLPAGSVALAGLAQPDPDLPPLAPPNPPSWNATAS